VIDYCLRAAVAQKLGALEARTAFAAFRGQRVLPLSNNIIFIRRRRRAAQFVSKNAAALRYIGTPAGVIPVMYSMTPRYLRMSKVFAASNYFASDLYAWRARKSMPAFDFRMVRLLFGPIIKKYFNSIFYLVKNLKRPIVHYL
jgi:hypothetical protein